MSARPTNRAAMQCPEAKQLFSPCLDGAVTGMQMLGMQDHLSSCAHCAKEYQLLRQTQRLLQNAARPKVPADLGLKMRLAISREVALAKNPPFQGLMVRFQNAMNAFMVPATAGFLSALVIFAIAMAYFVVPSSLLANNSYDVPLVMVNTAPELQQSAYDMTSSTINADSLVIEAYIGSNGRVQDYRILSDPPESQKLLPQVKQMLIFTTFRPALSMGQPTSGRAVLSFSKLSGRG